MANSTKTILDNLTSKMMEVLSRSKPLPLLSLIPRWFHLASSWMVTTMDYGPRKDKLGYINEDYPQPPETDPSFHKWRIENAMVKDWLINSMDHYLVVNFIRYPTTKQTRYDRLDHVWSDVLRLKPFPSIEQAYAHIRREDFRQSVMVSRAEVVASGAIMAIKGVKSGHSQTLLKSGSSSQSKGHSDGNKCTHCGITKHTRETCFKLHGYLDWWHELQAQKK
ncbi:hypothetical protein CK203_034463 [Vitis vinifera]|uniref:Retrotransposon Copia-like N-terminal domain-containing protein n=1 Tax=Vitis vinifera TaxID=29760 RepID=A0A438HZH8_VITVI|nr:hypothetical protein CK203_034463 [Vitis vinifera]